MQVTHQVDEHFQKVRIRELDPLQEIISEIVSERTFRITFRITHISGPWRPCCSQSRDNRSCETFVAFPLSLRVSSVLNEPSAFIGQDLQGIQIPQSYYTTMSCFVMPRLRPTQAALP